MKNTKIITILTVLLFTFAIEGRAEFYGHVPPRREKGQEKVSLSLVSSSVKKARVIYDMVDISNSVGPKVVNFNKSGQLWEAKVKATGPVRYRIQIEEEGSGVFRESEAFEVVEDHQLGSDQSKVAEKNSQLEELLALERQLEKQIRYSERIEIGNLRERESEERRAAIALVGAKTIELTQIEEKVKTKINELITTHPNDPKVQKMQELLNTGNLGSSEAR